MTSLGKLSSIRTEDSKVRQLYSRLLRLGSRMGGVIILTGFLLQVLGVNTDSSLSLERVLHYKASSLTSQSLLQGMMSGSPLSIQLVGLLILILTPTARVFLSIYLFIRLKDRPMALLACISLLFLGLGLFIRTTF